MIPYIITEEKISMFLDGSPITVTKETPLFFKVEEILKSSSENKEEELRKVIAFSSQKEKMPEDKDFLSPAILERLNYLREKKLPLTPIENFIENLKKNPSVESAKDLYGFLESCDLPITEDGYFLAYKKVNENFKDCHTGTIDNSVGAIVQMDRAKVNPNREVTCSTGLHVCSKRYLSEFNGKHTVVVKVNPADVVSVPVDYRNSKMRVCKYEVIGIISIDEGESIKPLIASTSKKESSSTENALSSAKKVVKNLDKAGKFNAYCKERNLPELLADMTSSQRSALKKFCARLLYGGPHAAGKEINSCLTLSELKTVTCGE